MKFSTDVSKLPRHRLPVMCNPISARFKLVGISHLSLHDLVTIAYSGEVWEYDLLAVLDALEVYDDAIHELFVSSGDIQGFLKALDKKLEELNT